MDQENRLLVLASLLHDAGKLSQRAGGGRSKDLVGEYCPLNDRRQPTHTHVLYTDYFIENDLPLPLGMDSPEFRSRLARLAACHHKPAESDLLERAIAFGDRLSAGADRIGGEVGEGDYKSARLVSVFEQVAIEGEKSPERIATGMTHRLVAIEEDPFPHPLGETKEPDYLELYKRFSRDLKNLPLNLGFRHYLNGLVCTLERYWWCIPSSTYKTMPDISLFDHALTAAAIAQALLVHHREVGGLPGSDSAVTKKFILLGGDLSGIQKYIFELDRSHAAGVAKLFRARSFYLQALTRSVVLKLLSELDLLPPARVMDAGGRFVLLLPATDRIREAVDEFEIRTQKWFFHHFYGQLSLSLSREVELTEKDLEQRGFRDRLDDLQDQLERKKSTRFNRLFATGVEAVFPLDYPDYAEGGACQICQVRPVDETATTEFNRRHESEISLCIDCQKQIDYIGAKLPTHDYLIIGPDTVPEDDGGRVALFEGLELRLIKNEDLAKATGLEKALEIAAYRERREHAYAPLAGHLPVAGIKDLSTWHQSGYIDLDGQGRFTYKEEIIEPDQPITFNLLAALAREPAPGGDFRMQGKAFLAALKADVDNLGLIFSLGLGERLSLARFAALSRMLNHFFADHLVRVIKDEFPEIYIIFAGGDDLFLLGPWRQMVRFCDRLGQEFRRYTADNDEVTLSAGLSIVRPRLPVQEMANQADESLKASKNRQVAGMERKNAVTCLNTTVNWDAFSELIEKGDRLFELIGEGHLNTGLLNRLLHYGRQREKFEKKGRMDQGLWKSHMAYDFARNVEQKKAIPSEIKQEMMKFQEDEILLDNFRLPISLALYRARRG